jgi:hypothetical protein
MPGAPEPRSFASGSTVTRAFGPNPSASPRLARRPTSPRSRACARAPRSSCSSRPSSSRPRADVSPASTHCQAAHRSKGAGSSSWVAFPSQVWPSPSLHRSLFQAQDPFESVTRHPLASIHPTPCSPDSRNAPGDDRFGLPRQGSSVGIQPPLRSSTRRMMIAFVSVTSVAWNCGLGQGDAPGVQRIILWKVAWYPPRPVCFDPLQPRP